MALRKILGYFLLIVSTIAWFALPVIPFLPYDPVKLAAAGGSVFIFAEITWWTSVLLLGKEIYGLFNHWLKRIRDLLQKNRKEEE